MASSKKTVYTKDFNLCDRNHFLILKGISMLAALIAVFCEDFLNIGNSDPIVHAAAAVFVLCSGFGVSESYLKKEGLVHYWENKMIKVWIPSVIIMVGLSIIRTGNIAAWIAEAPLGLKGELLYLIFAGYGVFWLIYKNMENKNARVADLFLCAAVVFIFMPNDMWMKPLLFAFPMGVLLSQTGWKRAMIKADWGVKILVLATCVIVAAGGELLVDLVTVPYIQTFLLTVCYIAIALTCILLTYYLQRILALRIFIPVGMAAYAVYLTYEDIFQMFAGKTDPKMYAAMFAVVIAVAAVLTWLRELLISWNYNLRRKNRVHLKGSME